MKRSTARWTTAVGVAALLAVPSSGFAQAAAAPQTPPPASAQATQPATPQEHLRKAEEAINAIPASAVTGQDKTKINDLKQRINKLEGLAGTSGKPAAGWDKEVAGIDRVLTELIGPATGAATTGTAGTAGKAAGSATLNAEARAQLSEVRSHITAFAAGIGKGSEPEPDAASTAAAPPTSAAQPPMTTQPPMTSSSGTAGAVGTTGTQPPAQATEPQQSAPQAQSVDPDAAKRHLTAARNSLSEMTQLPAAAQLTGDARTQVTQLISNFNELITTNAQWRESYAKVQANLTALIGSETTDESAARSTATGTAGAVGTSGAAAALDPAIRAKLVDFRNHLEKFEQAAGGAKPASAPDDPAASAAPPATSSTPPPTSTPPATSAPPGTMEPQSPAASAPASSGQVDRQEVMRHVQAIETLLQLSGAATPTGTSGTAATATAQTQSGVTLTPEQVSQLKTHLAELKRLLEPK